MGVDTRFVQGRRELNFASLDEVVADAQRLVSAPATKVLGNWPLERLFTHLALAINGSIDGIEVKAPWYARLMGPLMKRRLMSRKLSPGFRLPENIETGFYPPAASVNEAFEKLRMAVARLKTEQMTARHPVLGKLTHDEWTKLHLRHAELHLSFAVPRA